jgi:cytidyltransferase-like protein
MRIGFTNGCFDLLHSGHKWFLRECYDQCDWLIVGVDSDENVSRKGPGRPAQSLAKRLERLSSCPFVDAAIPFTGSPVPLLAVILPTILFRGADQSDEGREHAGQLVVISRLEGFSTTNKLAKLRS